MNLKNLKNKTLLMMNLKCSKMVYAAQINTSLKYN